MQVTPLKRGGLTKSWIFRFKVNGRQRDMGLGSLTLVGLAEARSAVIDARRLLYSGIDPIEEREERRRNAKFVAARIIPFKICAETYIKDHSPGWKNEKHKQQWSNTLATYAYPVIGDLPVQTVGTAEVTKVLEPIWQTKAETARRLRSRIEVILDAAKVKGYRDGENPARWRGHLDKLLLARRKAPKHHTALHWQKLAAFMPKLASEPGAAVLALRFLILTAARTGEVTGARWDEIDLASATWTVPAERMKADRQHRVPLSTAAVKVLKEAKKLAVDRSEFVCPGRKKSAPLSNMAFLMLLRRVEGAGLTAHGFRSTFRDWVSDQTNYPRELAEIALAHIVASATEEAYKRSDRPAPSAHGGLGQVLRDAIARTIERQGRFAATPLEGCAHERAARRSALGSIR